MIVMKKKRRVLNIAICLLLCMGITGCDKAEPVKNRKTEQPTEEDTLEEARTTPYGRYPECVTYTLGKMTGSNNSNMPKGDTYEDNAYTRYLRNMINVQNRNTFEAYEDYDDVVSMAIATREIPDIMVVSNIEDVQKLVEEGLVEDLTESYENCASDRIKDIYASYGDSFFDNVTFDGKMMAIPETNIDDGPTMLWLRKDWLDMLDLEEPKTMQDVEHIVSEFIAKNPGNNGENETVGLLCDTNLVGESGYSYEYQLDVLFASYGAYPRQWLIKGDSIFYGSVQPEVKQALAKLRKLYQAGVLDNQFLVRTTTNMIELIEEGKCGSFFGPWWAPNNPLMSAISKNPDADWQPYMIATDADGSVSYCMQNPSYKYVVVRKGYKYPEVAIKILNVMYDYLRYEDKQAEEISYYYQMNVDVTARPISINVDYQDALKRCYSDLTAVMEGNMNESDLELLEASYYSSCQSYLDSEEQISVEDWAAYTSRIMACRLLNETKIQKVSSVYFAETETMRNEWWKLRDLEKNTFLQIVTGTASIDEFDNFVEQWNAEGGRQITFEVNQEIGKH